MNPNIITIGNFTIKWYSVLILIGFVLAYLITTREAKKFGIEKDFIFNLFFWTTISGLIGARLYYVIFNFSLFKDNLMDIIMVWHGGLAIHGGIIAGCLAIYLYTKKHKVRTIRYLDFVSVPLLLAQAIGRWGNFFNGEAHGPATTLSHLQSLHIPQFIINGMHIGEIYYSPTFLYESVWCLFGFIVLLILRRREHLHVSELTGGYLIWYSFGRFIIEASRTDSLMFMGFKVAQIVSIILTIIGIILIVIARRKGKFTDLYNDVNNIDSVKYY